MEAKHYLFFIIAVLLLVYIQQTMLAAFIAIVVVIELILRGTIFAGRKTGEIYHSAKHSIAHEYHAFEGAKTASGEGIANDLMNFIAGRIGDELSGKPGPKVKPLWKGTINGVSSLANATKKLMKGGGGGGHGGGHDDHGGGEHGGHDAHGGGHH